MKQFIHPRILAASALLGARATIGMTPSHALTIPDAVADHTLGVAFTSLPSGWSVAPPGQYTPGTVGLITMRNGESDVRLSVQPLRTTDTSDEAAAANAAADKLTQESNSSTPIKRTYFTVAGSQGIMLEGMPGPAGLEIVVAHGGALYNVVTFDSNTLQPDQLQALARLHFVPRIGSFPLANPAAPRGLREARQVPETTTPSAHTANTPNSIDGHIQMYVFWGQSVSAGCGSHGGALADNCGGYWYGEGDHNGQDSYAIDWSLNEGNSVFPQTSTPQVTHAGWTQGKFYGYGNWVVLDNGWGVASYYAHLKDVTVTAGTKAQAGYSIGHSGCTGNCSGPHVHAAWVQNPTCDAYGQPFNGTGEPQTPLYTHSSTPQYKVNSLNKGDIVNGW